MHPSNHWILSIYSLRIGRRQCVPDSSIFRWLRNLPNGWLIGCEKRQGPLSFPRLQTDVDTQGKKHHAHPDLARNNLTKIHWFHLLPFFSQFHALSTSFQSPFRLDTARPYENSSAKMFNSSYPERNFRGNQLLDASISLSPLYPSVTNDLHVSIAMNLHQSFPWLRPSQA